MWLCSSLLSVSFGRHQMAFHVAYSFLRPITSSGHNLICLQWCLLPPPHNLSCDSVTLILPLATFHQIFRWASWVNGAGWENWHRTRRSWWRANVCATERRAHLLQHLLALPIPTLTHICNSDSNWRTVGQTHQPPLVHTPHGTETHTFVIHTHT